jgi:PAS domain S-box-containing protein
MQTNGTPRPGLEKAPAAAEWPGPDGPELEQTCQALETQLVRYRELFEFASDGYIVTNHQGIIEEANAAAARLFQTRKAFLRGKPLPFFVVPGERGEFYTALSRLNLGHLTLPNWEVTLQRPNSPPRQADITVTAFADATGKVSHFLWLLRDLTAQRRVEAELRAEQGFAAGLLDTAQVIVLVLDGHGALLRCNRYLETASGYGPDRLGENWSDLLLAEEHRAAANEQVHDTRSQGESGPRVYTLVTRDGRRREVVWSGKLLPVEGQARMVLLVGQDITELQEIQRQADHLGRLAAIGQMATGLAHESRNALQRAQACLQLLHWKLQDRPEMLDLLARMHRAHDDLLRLYEGVRAYAAPIRPQRRACNLADVWCEVWGQVTATRAGRDARLEADTDGLSVDCDADPFTVGQVFRNVFENALDACPDPVVVRVACAETDLAGKPALQIAVRDNGPGLSPEQRQRIFDPFFTTKTKGTGLGMAIAKRIVGAHGGRIAVGEAQGPGAEIVITLPRRSQP